MVSDNPESFADLDGHDGIGSSPYAFCSEDKACSSAVDNCGDAPGACQATLAGEFLRDVTVEDANGQTEPADEQKADDEAAAGRKPLPPPYPPRIRLSRKSRRTKSTGSLSRSSKAPSTRPPQRSEPVSQPDSK